MQKIPKCIDNSPASHICMNQECSKPNPFVCGANHNCQHNHNRCLKFQWLLLKEELDQKKYNMNPTFKLLTQKVEKIIKQGIEQLKAQLSNFYKWHEQYGISRNIISFYESIQIGKQENWTGKHICQLKNQKNSKFDNMNINPKKILNEMNQIEAKCSEFIKKIKRLYNQQTWLPQKFYQIKQYYLSNLNKRLEQLNQQPEHMELRFDVSNWIVTDSIQKLAILLSQKKFWNLRTLTIYFSNWPLTNDKYHDKICQQLLKLPKLELFTVVVSEIKSDSSLKPIMNRLQVVVNKYWYKNQKW